MTYRNAYPTLYRTKATLTTEGLSLTHRGHALTLTARDFAACCAYLAFIAAIGAALILRA